MLGHYEGSHMNSSEGEKVPFKAAVRLEGVVEVCTTVYNNVITARFDVKVTCCLFDILGVAM